MFPDVPVSPWEIAIVASFIVPYVVFALWNILAMNSPEYKNRKIF
ncbi:hypothetical protein PHABIO_239 [Pseudomonas phage Phabio]|uniref:Uncharacterized protein n=1 Tax=Pseudomonas phage Phabio TaxID=2006668 RepID=A0A1Y0SU61_9CAUD|nr:hypothetical protein MZD05_gp239 [Pseudomonas phage Phabio]ARV76870.1 hypothetical protein PHABIO_239 [Pseudomonas phage Phabio]